MGFGMGSGIGKRIRTGIGALFWNQMKIRRGLKIGIRILMGTYVEIENGGTIEMATGKTVGVGMGIGILVEITIELLFSSWDGFCGVG